MTRFSPPSACRTSNKRDTSRFYKGATTITGCNRRHFFRFRCASSFFAWRYVRLMGHCLNLNILFRPIFNYFENPSAPRASDPSGVQTTVAG